MASFWYQTEPEKKITHLENYPPLFELPNLSHKRPRETNDEHDSPDPKVSAGESIVNEAIQLLHHSFPRALRLSEHPKLSALLETTIMPRNEIFIPIIETLFDSGFINQWLLEHQAQILIFRTFKTTPEDTWLLMAPAKSTYTSRKCAMPTCDRPIFPHVSFCLFHHEVHLAIEALIQQVGEKIPKVMARRKPRYYAGVTEETILDTFWSVPCIFDLIPGSFLNTMRAKDHQGVSVSFPVPRTLDEYRRDPARIVAQFDSRSCRICPNPLSLRFPDYDLTNGYVKEAAAEWDGFCDKHQRELAGPNQLPHVECSHKDRGRGRCHCLFECRQHEECCHPCFVRELYAKHAGEPFPQVVGPSDIQQLVFSYMKPKVYFGCILEW